MSDLDKLFERLKDKSGGYAFVTSDLVEKAFAESEARRVALEEAREVIAFYADPNRYNGANQSITWFTEKDKYAEREDFPFLQDVTRDGGEIAQAWQKKYGAK